MPFMAGVDLLMTIPAHQCQMRQIFFPQCPVAAVMQIEWLIDATADVTRLRQSAFPVAFSSRLPIRRVDVIVVIHVHGHLAVVGVGANPVGMVHGLPLSFVPHRFIFGIRITPAAVAFAGAFVRLPSVSTRPI